MVAILALETTTDVCSVALGTADHKLENTRLAPRQHNALILGMIDELLSSSPWQRSDLECVAFSAGPGSFTGTRIGCAVAQGIALALDIPVAALPSSMVMARVTSSCFASLASFELRRRSRGNLVYASTYRASNGDVECIENDRLLDDSENPADLPVVRDGDVSVSAGDVLDLALLRPELAVEPQLALPIHVEGDTPYKPSNP